MVSEPTQQSEEARGFSLGVAAYALWGLFPLYWPLLKPAGAIEILAHRVSWSLVTMVVLVVALRRTSQLRAIFGNPRTLRLLVLASVVVADNVGFPGAPAYRAHMREHEGRTWRTVEHKTHVEYQSLVPDLVLESTYLGAPWGGPGTTEA